MGGTHFSGAVRAKACIAAPAIYLLFVFLLSPAVAAENSVTFDIPAQPLAAALELFRKQSGVQVTLSESQCKECRGHSVSGPLTPTEALRVLLVDTGLTFTSIEKGNVALVPREDGGAGKSMDAPIPLGQITVIANRVTTEGTGSYTSSAVTVAGKEPLSVHEIPNSVSVITRQLMDDRNMVHLSDAMQQATGVSLSPGSDLYSTYYYSRGYIMNGMTDGMSEINSRYHQWDLAIYDRIEIIRGPFGLLQGGSLFPSGTINVVRKLPRDTFAISATASAGTWDNYSGMFDVTGPLLRNKKIRARLVVAGTDRDYFWNRDNHEQKWVGYGVIEADVAPRTMFTLKLAMQDTENPGYAGNPSFTDGRQLGTPRSFSPYVDWNRYVRKNKDATAGIEHRFDSEWVAKLQARNSQMDTTTHELYPASGVNPVTLKMDSTRRAIEYTYRWLGTDMYVTGPFNVFNRTHKALFGWSYNRWTSESYTSGSYKNDASGKKINTPIFDISGPGLSSEVRPAYIQGTNYDYWESGFYGKLQLKVVEPLTVVLGGRLGDYTTQTRYVPPSIPTYWTRGYTAKNEFTKYGGIIYDLTRQINLYTSYSDIFVPQTSGTWPDNKPLDPRIGEQYEIGSKGQFFDKRLNTGVALFYMTDKNRAYNDLEHPGYYISAGKVMTKGFEVEATGSPLPGLQITAGYTYARTEYQKDSSSQGKDVNQWSPVQMLKLWGVYRFPRGYLRNLSVGGGVNAQSETVAQGTGYYHRQGGYAIYSAQAGYQISRNLKATLTCNNIFDKVYYSTVGSLYLNNIYGDPRNFMLTLHASF